MARLQNTYTFDAHEEICWAIDVHQKLGLLASVSADRTCKIFDLKSRKLVATLGDSTHTKTTRSVAFKPSVEFPTVAVGSFDATISIWGCDSVEGEEEPETVLNDEQDDNSSIIGDGGWELLAIIEGHENEVKCVDWSYDGKYLATCSRDKSAWIWETDETNEEFECINVIQEHDQDVKHVTWHPAMNMLATSSYDETCRVFRQDVYDEDDWVCVANMGDSKSTVWCSDFEKKDDGTVRFVSSTDNGEIKVYKKEGKVGETATSGIALPSSVKDEEQWKLESVLPSVHDRAVYSVSWNKNGLIASCGCDGRIGVYKESSPGRWEAVASVSQAHGVREVNCVRWYGDSQLLTAGDEGKVKLWTLSD